LLSHKYEPIREYIVEYLTGPYKGDTRLFSLSPWVSWQSGDERIVLDGEFTVEELEAFAAFMRECKDSNPR
jgi:hypothetical protein